ncbi:hypothetical protein MRX96_010408 [Rhipicephalus microplus]
MNASRRSAKVVAILQSSASGGGRKAAAPNCLLLLLGALAGALLRAHTWTGSFAPPSPNGERGGSLGAAAIVIKCTQYRIIKERARKEPCHRPASRCSRSKKSKKRGSCSRVNMRSIPAQQPVSQQLKTANAIWPPLAWWRPLLARSLLLAATFNRRKMTPNSNSRAPQHFVSSLVEKTFPHHRQ